MVDVSFVEVRDSHSMAISREIHRMYMRPRIRIVMYLDGLVVGVELLILLPVLLDNFLCFSLEDAITWRTLVLVRSSSWATLTTSEMQLEVGCCAAKETAKSAGSDVRSILRCCQGDPVDGWNGCKSDCDEKGASEVDHS